MLVVWGCSSRGREMDAGSLDDVGKIQRWILVAEG